MSGPRNNLHEQLRFLDGGNSNTRLNSPSQSSSTFLRTTPASRATKPSAGTFQLARITPNTKTLAKAGSVASPARSGSTGNSSLAPPLSSSIMNNRASSNNPTRPPLSTSSSTGSQSARINRQDTHRTSSSSLLALPPRGRKRFSDEHQDGKQRGSARTRGGDVDDEEVEAEDVMFDAVEDVGLQPGRLSTGTVESGNSSISNAGYNTAPEDPTHRNLVTSTPSSSTIPKSSNPRPPTSTYVSSSSVLASQPLQKLEAMLRQNQEDKIKCLEKILDAQGEEDDGMVDMEMIQMQL